MSRSTLAGAISLVSSDKIKERTEGCQLLRQMFAISSNVEALSSTADGWLKILQALFGAVAVERTASLRTTKSSSGASSSNGEGSCRIGKTSYTAIQ